MNSKKHGKQSRRVPKFNAKPNRGSQHRRGVEGKSNIGTIGKRVTLLPGFLSNGFTSGTTKKTKGERIQKTKDHLLAENIQAFLERKSNLRRSERISKKHNKRNTSSPSKQSPRNDICDDLDLPSVSNVSHIQPTEPTSVSIKSILKKRSKSIFKEISDKFSKVHIQSSSVEPQRINVVQPAINHLESSNNNIAEGFMFNPSSINNKDFLNPVQLHRRCDDRTNNLPPNKQFPTLFYNNSICEDFFRKVHVSFKKSPIEDCQENIKREINTANLVLQGKVQRKETVFYNGEDSDSDTKDSDNILPIPVKKWVYCTPPNQKISVSQVEECQLKPALLCVNNNRCNLYEFNANERNRENCKKIGPIKNTPANFGPKRTSDNHLAENGPHHQGLWGGHPGYNVGIMNVHNPQQLPYIPPPYANIVDHQLKTAMPIHTDFMEKLILSPTVPKTSGNPNNVNFYDAQHVDFTLIADGNDFHIQESQPAYRNKRLLIDEDEYLVKKRNCAMEAAVGRCEEPKMFNFNSQERNLFDFSVIM